MALSCLTGCFGWKPTKMPRADEEDTQVWLIWCKLLFFIPVAVAAFDSRRLYNIVRDIPAIQHSPYNEHIVLAHLLTYTALMTIFSWMLISAALLMWKYKQWRSLYIFLLGFSDLALALTLGAGIVLQAAYLPSTSSGCSNSKTWQVVDTNSTRSFFSAIVAATDGGDPDVKCRKFVSAWSEAVACLSFQMLLAYIGIFFDEREFSLLNPFRPLICLIFIIASPPYWVHSRVTPRLRFIYFYLLKLGLQAQQKPLEFEKPEPYVPSYENITVDNLGLQQILTIEHVLLSLVDNLHYEDVINLSLTSKCVREAVFPIYDLEYRVPKLKRAVCKKDSKKPCLYCNKKICFECKETRFLAGLPGRRHVQTCTPYCGKCYYTRFARYTPGLLKLCKCTITDKSHEFQQMCRTCSNIDPTVLRDARYKRYQQEARDIAVGKFLPPGEKTKCGNCNADLKSGARWWVCGKCKGECRDGIHPGFVMKQKIVDVEKPEMEDRESRKMEASRWTKWIAPFRNQ